LIGNKLIDQITYELVLNLIGKVGMKLVRTSTHFLEVGVPVIGEKLFAVLDLPTDPVKNFALVLNGHDVLLI
jgi:hypothetical protein